MVFDEDLMIRITAWWNCSTDLVVSSVSSWSQRVWPERKRWADWVFHSFLWLCWGCLRSGRHWTSPAPSPAFSAWWGSWRSLLPWPVWQRSGNNFQRSFESRPLDPEWRRPGAAGTRAIRLTTKLQSRLWKRRRQSSPSVAQKPVRQCPNESLFVN